MKRINSLEGLRGIASLMVLFSHLGVMFYPAYYWGAEETGGHCGFIEYYLGQTPLSFIFAGHSAVMIFFVLTGFGTFMVCDKGRDHLVKYASLRFFKLAVLLILSTIIMWALLQSGLVFYHDTVGYTGSPWIAGWGACDHNIIKVLFGNWFTIGAAYNPVLWTMPYVFISSIICVMLYMLWGNLQKGFVVPLCIGTFFLLFGMKNYVACIMGYLLAYYYKQKPDRHINIAIGVLLLLLAVFLCGYPMEIQSSWILYRFLPKQYVVYYHTLGGGVLLIYSALFCSPIKKILESKAILAFGKYSMSLFVVHFAVLMSVTSYLFTRLIGQYSYNKAVLIVWMVTVMASCIAAVLLKWVIDRVYGGLDRVYHRVYRYLNGF